MIVGITGHRKLSNAAWVRTALQQIFEEISITHGFTCLAAGADELFAKLLLQNHVGYTAVIPCVNYDLTFEKSTLNDFLFSKKNASDLIELNIIEPTEEAFSEAGKIVVDRSEILIAVWDAQNAKGLGGTGDIVEYAKLNEKKIIHINPLTKTKSYINHN